MNSVPSVQTILTLTVFIAVHCVPGFAITVDNCPASLPRDGYLKVFRDTCYQFQVDTFVKHQQAQDYCQTHGGALVMVKSEEINGFLQFHLSKSYSLADEPVWIGLKYNQSCQAFTWRDGTAAENYSNFAATNFLDIFKDCVVMVPRSGQWRRVHCDTPSWFDNVDSRFVCQFPALSVGTVSPPTKSNVIPTKKIPPGIPDSCPYGVRRDNYLKVFGDHCYRFELEETKDFENSEKYCEREGGHLVIVDSDEVNAFLVDELTKLFNDNQSHPAWIGLRYNDQDWSFQWVDGSGLNYTNFGQFTFEDPDSCVTLDSRSGEWALLNCHDTSSTISKKNASKPFICEYPSTRLSTMTATATNPTTTTTATTITTTTLTNSPRTSTTTTQTTPTTVTTTIIPTTTTTTASTTETLTKTDCRVPGTSGKFLQFLGNICYYFNLTHSLPFDQAEKYCESLGGSLVLAKSWEINRFIYHHLLYTYGIDCNSYPLWIGLRYDFTRQGYFWMDGEPLSFFRHFRWYYNHYDCATISPWDGRWTTSPCGCYRNGRFIWQNNYINKHFICQFQAVPHHTAHYRHGAITH